MSHRKAMARRRAIRKLHNAFEYLRLRMGNGANTPANDEAQSGEVLAVAMLKVLNGYAIRQV